jgi:DNA-binding LytR/AlgR family response regulator
VFERTHKSYLVRMSAVARLFSLEGSRYELELRNGVRLPVGRTRYPALKARLIA